MDRLSQSLKAVILLGVIRNDQLLYLDKRESDSIIRVSSHIGLKRPPYYGMLGMVMLAHMETAEIWRLLTTYPPSKITEKTVTDIDEIIRRLEATRGLGYYIEEDEVIEGFTGIGVPIMDLSGKVVAAIGATQPTAQLKGTVMEKTIKELISASRSISQELGYIER
jgi:DNA-binding IclR family transcriptional regulator